MLQPFFKFPKEIQIFENSCHGNIELRNIYFYMIRRHSDANGQKASPSTEVDIQG